MSLSIDLPVATCDPLVIPQISYKSPMMYIERPPPIPHHLLKKKLMHIVSAPKYCDSIELGGRCIVPALLKNIIHLHYIIFSHCILLCLIRSF